VLQQVRWDDGPWIPASVPVGTGEQAGTPPDDRDGMHSGIGGLALVLAEVRAQRPWTVPEQTLADAIAERLRAGIATQDDCSFFDGLASIVGSLVALGSTGVDDAVARLLETVTADGWPQRFVEPPRYLPDARVNDLTLGTAGVLAAALWARRHHAVRATELADVAADLLLAEAEEVPAGTSWRFVPARFLTDARAEMPNLSHGVAGIAATLAVAGRELGRPELTAAAASGAEHLVTLGDTSDGGFFTTRCIPSDKDDDFVTYNWCHGPAGTSLLFAALDGAGVPEVAGETPEQWRRRCLRSVRTSGVPQRLTPGFWDNDGRCCGTAGVGDVFLDSWHRTGDESDLEFALSLADTVLERAVHDGAAVYWRFVEHRAADPLLPPGVGWAQGAAGMVAFLLHVGRVAADDGARPVARMDSWWAHERS
jgi:hypothetical protein